MRNLLTGLLFLFAAALIATGCKCSNCGPTLSCSVYTQGQELEFACDTSDCDCAASVYISFGFVKNCLDDDGNPDCTDCTAVGCITCTLDVVHYYDDDCYESTTPGVPPCQGDCVYI